LDTYPVPVVCILVHRKNEHGVDQLLLQKRVKTREQVDYYGLWELPQGKVERGELILDAITRELSEETALEAVGLSPVHCRQTTTILDSRIDVFCPTLCVLDIEHGYVGFGLITRTLGEVHATAEAQDHRWVTKGEASSLISAGTVFPLNVPIIQEFFSIGD
jgi:8-oxo-dGTP pyrophosphatase MutT (NUDIX family)